jgi:hypothetical protein
MLLPYLSSYANPALSVLRKRTAAKTPTATQQVTGTLRPSDQEHEDNDDDDDELLLLLPVGDADRLRGNGRWCFVMAVNKTNVVSNPSLSSTAWAEEAERRMSHRHH